MTAKQLKEPLGSSAVDQLAVPAPQAEVQKQARPLVRRVAQQESQRKQDVSTRRRQGAFIMSVIAVATLLFRRKDYDSPWVMLVESLFGILLLGLAAYVQSRIPRNRESSQSEFRGKRDPALNSQATTWWGMELSKLGFPLLVTAALILPWLVDFVARRSGFGNGSEILMLASLAWGSVAAALGRDSRTVSMSVVCSGFLTLFTTLIADDSRTVFFAYAWGVFCLGWLVANHWEQVEACAAIKVQATRSNRLVVIGLTCAVFLVVTSLVSDRIPVLRQLRAEIMPTSGGTTGNDEAARHGVGNGQALVAARQHATSFGAVETDLFLDSEKPSLFDVYSEEFGEPKFNKRVERAQALNPNETQSDEGQFSEANRGSNTNEFSTQREAPRRQPPVEDLESNALFFWQGESGVRLAAERFSHFDGIHWSNPADANKAETTPAVPPKLELGDRVWFKPSLRLVQNTLSPFVDALQESAKFTRYGSATIPTRSGMQLWSIDKITEADFFAMSNECLIMPGREQVPDYTVVRFVNSRIDLERVVSLLQDCAPGKSHLQLGPECSSQIAALAHAYAGSSQRGWPQVEAVISNIRKRFKISTEPAESGKDTSLTPLESFLLDGGGPRYLFPTAAASMLQHLGYETRLVSGFYADPRHLLKRDGETAITPQDAHVWLEINVGHDYWIPLEPTPGYRLPRYTSSLWFRIRQARNTILLGLLATSLLAAMIVLLRRQLFELACFVTWPVIARLGDRKRVAWVSFVLDQRLRLAGCARPQGCIPREHMKTAMRRIPTRVCQELQRYFGEADQICFGGTQQLSNSGRHAARIVWQQMTVQVIRRALASQDQH
ncbi:MAG: transglutaminase-like domain-containing protein [bacterium]|nr:transglutaminase-like domain-containing protein [bacterium]